MPPQPANAPQPINDDGQRYDCLSSLKKYKFILKKKTFYLQAYHQSYETIVKHCRTSYLKSNNNLINSFFLVFWQTLINR